MDTTIDTLSIEIETESSKSASGIDNLMNKLKELQTSVSNSTTKINNFMNSLKSLKTLGNQSIKIESNSPMITSTSTKTEKPTIDTNGINSEVEKVEKNVKKLNESKINIDTKKAERDVKNVSEILDNLQNNANKQLEIKPSTNANSLKELGESADNTKTKMNNLFSGSLKNSFKFVTSSIGNVRKGIIALGKNVSNVSNGIKNTVGMITKRLGMVSIALLGVRGAFTAVRKAVSAYMSYDTDLSEQLQNNWAVLGALIAPVLEKLIYLFGKAISYIAGFIKALTGIDLVARANERALNRQAKAAKKAASELGNIAKFDELNTVKFDKDDDSQKALSIGDIDTKKLDLFAERIKLKDWYGIGMEISRKINEGLRLIDFDWVMEKAHDAGKAMGDLGNGLTDGLDWVLVGNSITDGLNSVMELVNTFFNTYNFSQLGVGLGEALRRGISNFNWDELAQYMTNGFVAIIDVIDGFTKKFSEEVGNMTGFEELGKHIGETFNQAFDNLDILGSTKKVLKFLGGIFDTVNTFLQNVDWMAVGTELFDASVEVVSFLIENVPTLLGNLVNAIFAFIGNIDWWEALSTIVESIQTGLNNFFTTITGNEEVASVLTGIADAIGLIVLAIAGYNAGVKIYTAYTKLASAATHAWKVAQALLNGTMALNPIGLIVVAIGALIAIIVLCVKHWDTIKEAVGSFASGAAEVLKGLATIIGKIFVGIFENIKSIISTWFSYVQGVFTTVISLIANPFIVWRDTLKTVFSNVMSAFKNLFSGFKKIFTGDFKGALEDFKNMFKNIFDSLVAIATAPINLIIGALNALINGINKVKFDVPDWVPAIGGKKLGFNIPNIPKLATGTNKIEHEGLYYLHEGENVTPKKYNPAVNKNALSEGNEDTVQAIYSLIDVVKNLEITNTVNVGDEQVYKKTSSYNNRMNSIYGHDIY